MTASWVLKKMSINGTRWLILRCRNALKLALAMTELVFFLILDEQY